jgi:hypothetical protein
VSVTAAPTATSPPARIDITGYDGPADIAGQIQMAEFLAKAVATLPIVYRERPSDIFAVVLQARALNIPVMTAIHNLVWDETVGKGAMSAMLMGALLLRGGVVYTPEFVPTKMCAMTFSRLDGRPGGRCEWRITEAIGAGIAGSYTWMHYPDDMLFARCLARGARRFAPDLILGFGYTIDELREMSTDQPVDNDRAVEPDVAEFLAQVTDTTPAAKIQELVKLSATKKVDLAGKYAGNGQTVVERLNSLWLAAAGREIDRNLAAADRAMTAGPVESVVIPGAAAGTAAVKADVRDAPAGEGEAECRCPTARLIAGQGHDPAVCTKEAPNA